MSEYSNRIENSKIKHHIDVLFSRIEDVRELENLSQLEQDTIYRVHEAYKIVESRLSSVDPYLLSATILNNLVSNTNTIHTNLHQFAQYQNNPNQRSANIKNINTHLENVLIYVTQIFYPYDPSDVEALKDSIVSTRQSLSQHNRYIKGEYQEYKSARSAVEQQILELKSDLATIEQSFEDAEEKLLNQKNDFERIFSEKQQERTEVFSNLQREWNDTFNEQLAVMKDKFTQKITEVEESLQRLNEQLESRLNEYQKDIDLAKAELYSLVEIAGSDVMSDGYAKYANEAGKRRFWWQMASVVSLIGLVLSAIFIILPSIQGEDFSWSVLVSRAIITLSVGALSGYTMRQSQIAYQDEQRNREMQLKLGSIEPYLKNFGLEKRNSIKEQLVLDYFSVHYPNNPIITENQDSENQPLDSQQQEEQTTA